MERNAFFVGQGRLLIACAEAWLARGHRIEAVASPTPAITEWAEAKGLRCVAKASDLGAVPSAVDYLFSIVNHAVLPPDVLACARLAAINFHDSPLPRYSGFNATSWAIRDGQAQHGVTWHLMSALADSGAILVQQTVDILDDDTAFTLSARCDGAGIESFHALIAMIEASEQAPQPTLRSQPRADFRLRHERPGLGIVRFDQPANALLAQIRALDFGREDSWMCRAKLETPAGLFLIDDARLIELSGATPGTVCFSGRDSIDIATSSGGVRIERVSYHAGRPATLDACGLSVGDRLVARDPSSERAEAEADALHSPHERFWVERLSSLSPPEIPDVRPTSAAPDAATRVWAWDERMAQLAPPAKERLLIAAVSAYVLRTSEQIRFDLTLFKSVPDALASAYVPHVPLRIDASADATVSQLLAAVDAEQRTQEKRGLYAQDAVTRYRRLREAPPKPSCPIAIASYAASVAPADLLSCGASLGLITGADAGAPMWVYDRNTLAKSTFERVTARIEGLAAQMAAATDLSISELDLLTPQERRDITQTWQQTDMPVHGPALVHQMFEAQVTRTPEATALVFRNASITYRELNERANAVAFDLQTRGIGLDQHVGVCVNRSLEMVIALIGVLKAGGAYVPMDPAYPRARLAQMCEDARPPVIITTRAIASDLALDAPHLMFVDDGLSDARTDAPRTDTQADNLAYVIFTSGSTGRPKGVMVSHANVANFFTGMDERLGTEPGVWLAATSISFDISVLELFWTLSRGFKVVLQPEADRASLEKAAAIRVSPKPMDFSLFYFAATDGAESNPYRLLIEGAKYADTHGFSAVWTPERHFHAFGGVYPNPALTSAALATITSKVALRAGSVVLPLHDPIRVAEDWSLIDQLSGGRVGLSFASGWHANDFALMPNAYSARRDVMLSNIDKVMKLWRGEAVAAISGNGKSISVQTFPRPVQENPPIWLTAAGNPESFRLAGEMGANLLTNMLGQDLRDLESKIAVYHKARRDAGHEGPGTVSVMLHTFVTTSDEHAREIARAPFSKYLMSAYDLIKVAPSMFPAFRQPSLSDTADISFDAERFTDEDLAALMDHAFERYFETAGLFGTPATALRLIESLKAIGVTEVACLVDFGIAENTVLESLNHLDRLRQLANSGNDSEAEADLSIAGAIAHYGVTHLQCTPSAARMIAGSSEGETSLGRLRLLLVGGEALPADLAERLSTLTGGRVVNMYGPTETTVWSTTADVQTGKPVTIGHPIANTIIRIMDRHQNLAPIGVAGELFIGGAGVVRGYLGRPDLTAERFIADPLNPAARLYRTGDLARYRADGAIDFIGRADSQVKLNGYRIELGEIESVLARHAFVDAAVAIVRQDAAGASLAAYVIAASADGQAANDNARTKPWQMLWDNAYRSEATNNPRFDTSGWIGKLTGEQIAEGDMRAWLDETEQRILALKPRRVLEIGCGTGMVLFRLAAHVDHYTGVDVAAAALDKIRSVLREEERRKVHLEQMPAHEIDRFDDNAFDTIIINSVAQYFPDAAYLEQVIATARRKLTTGGRLFFGDVRWLEPLGAFHTLSMLQRLAPETPLAAARAELDARIAQDPELVISPDFFHALKSRLPGLSHVDVSLKHHKGALELTAFRYDVTLQFDAPVESLAPIVGNAKTLSDVLSHLASAPKALRVEGLANGRLSAAFAAWAAVCDAKAMNIAEVERIMDAAPEGVDPGALASLHPDYKVLCMPSASGDAAAFDALFVRKDAGADFSTFNTPRSVQRDAAALTNLPFRAEPKTELLIEELREHLARSLPAYMVPSAIVLLNAFPMTPNGKIDRAALPAPSASAMPEERIYLGASTDTQEKVASIWKTLLALDRVSVKDNIFDIGANSLLAVQAAQRFSVQFGRKVSLVSLFRYPTIESLAAFLDTAGTPNANDGANDQARVSRQQSAIDKRRNLRKALDT